MLADVSETGVAQQSQRFVEAAILAAVEAGAIALEGFRYPQLDVETKRDPSDVVTEYDRRCEQLIASMLIEAYPDSTIVGEEGGTLEGTGPLTWYVDPIDGTANFARGIALWAVSIGVARDGELVAGVIFDPVAGQLFWADERGAFLRTRDGLAWGEDQPLRSAGQTSAGRATVALNFPLARDLVHFPALALEQFAAATTEFSQLRGLHSTCIALAWIAAGWIDATVSFETNPWDVAAGAFLIRRAGGTFYGYRDGAAVPGGEAHLAPHYCASVAGAEFGLLHEIMRTQSLRP